ncbi:hypothetical protein [Streptomyces sp. NBC_01481]|uniref:hypothetical protein n=1 Tax=Streptomyces sp. NBC_01481 TaxID=2975869 RepID=UPI00224DA9FE|nr:hypothetical protein [Streptomyces sp. NBC_01481]MCX4582395.1 hypothetical protein [Streptomyces sp. NBC_01481]
MNAGPVRVHRSLVPRHHAASGGGTFKHYVAATGETLTGTFQARWVNSFTSYGNGTPQGAPADWFGGLLILAVDITPDTDPKARIPAILTIDCLLGSPPAGAEEGIKLIIPGLINFDTIVPGSATVFVQI